MTQYQPLPDGTVVKASSMHPLMQQRLFTVDDFSHSALSKINSVYQQGGQDREGCEVLLPGQQWVKGKYRYRVVVEFCPDEGQQ